MVREPLSLLVRLFSYKEKHITHQNNLWPVTGGGKRNCSQVPWPFIKKSWENFPRNVPMVSHLPCTLNLSGVIAWPYNPFPEILPQFNYPYCCCLVAAEAASLQRCPGKEKTFPTFCTTNGCESWAGEFQPCVVMDYFCRNLSLQSWEEQVLQESEWGLLSIVLSIYFPSHWEDLNSVFTLRSEVQHLKILPVMHWNLKKWSWI